jgi:hypothetical protein
MPASDTLADTNLAHKHGRTSRTQTAKLRRRLDTFIRRVDHAADVGLERHEWDDVLPGVLPGLHDRREALAPLLVEGLERLPGGFRVDAV